MKKIIIFLFGIFVFVFGALSAGASQLYVTENGTQVFLNPNTNHTYIFYEGYMVEDMGKNVRDFREVSLTDGMTAYIDSTKLSSSLNTKYKLHSQSATLVAEEFPLFLEPNGKANTANTIYRGEKLHILNANLINKVWVRVEDSKGNVGYIWYKTLDFSNGLDNTKRNLDLGSSIRNTTHIANIPSAIEKLKNQDYESYIEFLQKVGNLQETNKNGYTQILTYLEKESPDTYEDIMIMSSDELGVEDEEVKSFLDMFFSSAGK